MKPSYPMRHVALAGVVLVLAACDAVTESPTAPGAPSMAVTRGGPSGGEVAYIVATRSESLPEMLARDVRANGGELVGELPQIGVAFVRSSDPDFATRMGAESYVQGVARDDLIEFDDPTPAQDGLLDHASAPGAGVFDFLTWGIDAVGAPAAWAEGNRGAGVRVAVLDAGIDPDHPDLAPNLNADLSTSFVPCIFGNCDGDFEDWRILPGFYFNHGTHVAGTIAGAGTRLNGVAPEAELVVVKVCTEFINACFTSSIVSGIVYAADVDADLVNMSLGGLRRMRNDFVPFCRSLDIPTRICGRIASLFATGQDDYVHATILVYQRAFEYARRNGTTVIVAAGNGAMNADRSKDIKLAFADFPHTIGVSALGPMGWCLDPSTDVDQPAYYTNTGQSVIDVSAPGGNFGGFFEGPPHTDPCTVGFLTRRSFIFDGVLSTISEGWGWAQGTSMAAPHATGVAALLIAAHGGDMTPQEVEAALKANAEDLGKPGHDAIYGAGRVSAGN